MTDEKAIDLIKSECYVFNPLDFDRTVLINTALDRAIESMKWIPISDKLPELKRDVLVFLKNGRFFVCALFPGSAGQKYWWIGEEEIHFLFDDVVAWRPLPDPYKAESKLDGYPIDIDKAVEHYEGTLATLKGIDLEVDT